MPFSIGIVIGIVPSSALLNATRAFGGTKEGRVNIFYKHIVPMGLKRTKVCTSVQKLYTPHTEELY